MCVCVCTLHTYAHTHQPWSSDDYAWSVSNTNYCSGCFEKEYIVHSGFFRPLVVLVQSTVIYTFHPELRNLIFFVVVFLSLVSQATQAAYPFSFLRNKPKKSVNEKKQTPPGFSFGQKRWNQILSARVFEACNKTCTITAHKPPGKHELMRLDTESISRYGAITTKSSEQRLEHKKGYKELHYFISLNRAISEHLVLVLLSLGTQLLSCIGEQKLFFEALDIGIAELNTRVKATEGLGQESIHFLSLIQSLS